MNVIRLVVGGAIALVGAAVSFLALAREYLTDPLGLDWLDPSRVDQQVLGGDVNNFLLFIAGGLVVALGAWIAGRMDDWLG